MRGNLCQVQNRKELCSREKIQVSKQIQNNTKFWISNLLYTNYYSESFTCLIIFSLTKSVMSMSMCTGGGELGLLNTSTSLCKHSRGRLMASRLLWGHCLEELPGRKGWDHCDFSRCPCAVWSSAWRSWKLSEAFRNWDGVNRFMI